MFKMDYEKIGMIMLGIAIGEFVDRQFGVSNAVARVLASVAA